MNKALKEQFKVLEFKNDEKCVFDLKGDTEMKYKNIKITKRTDNRWQARFLEEGRYKFIYGHTQKECYDKLKEYLKEYEQPVKKKLTLNDWIKIWKDVYKKRKLKESTYYHLELELNKYVINSIGKKDLNKITILDIETLLNSIDFSRQRLKIYTYLKDIFDKALKNKKIKENVLINIERPNHIKKQSKAFSREEQAKFILACQNEKYGDYFLILLYQGMRSGELSALEINDIDFSKNQITINKTLNDNTKITSPKTQSSIRTIPLFNQAKSILEKYKSVKGRIFKSANDALQRNFHKILNKINLNDFTIHSLRHTFVTRWAEIGVSSKLIQKWVGHSSNSITEKIYTQINSDFENAEVLKKQDDFNKNFDTDFDTDF